MNQMIQIMIRAITRQDFLDTFRPIYRIKNRAGCISLAKDDTGDSRGHKEMTVPSMNTGPATQIHQTRGLTIILNPELPSSMASLGTTYRSSTGVECIPARVEAMLKEG